MNRWPTLPPERLVPHWGTPHGSALISVLLMILAVLLFSGCAANNEPSARQSTDASGGEFPAAAVADGWESPAVAMGDVVADIAEEAQEGMADPVEDAQLDVARAVIPAVMAMREAIVEVLPPPAAKGPVSLVSPAAVDLIVGFEIISAAYYVRRLQGVVCPPRLSGPTRGVGWDDGHQTRTAIANAWPDHPQLARILPASGQVGAAKCNAYRNANRDIRTPLDMAERVFAGTALPAYHGLTARTFRNGWDALPPNAQGALVATVYNRGASMMGKGKNDPRREMRVLRDECVPAADTQCMAEQFLSMRRLWPANVDGGKGLQRRYTATAALAVRA